MAMQPATLAELQTALQATITQALNERPTTGAIFQLMYNTGLRVREVLEVDRWQYNDDDTFTVQLEKREGTRVIPISQVPDAISDRFIDKVPFEMETYSAVNNTFKYSAPGIIFGNDTRRTTSHAFRYQFVKQLAQEGKTVAEIAAILGHVNQANTSKYMSDQILLGN
jgi:site-specific recombinase XerD